MRKKSLVNDTFITVPLDAKLQSLASNFACGGPIAYDVFIKSARALDSSYGKTFVVLTEESDAVVGYYNIGVSEIIGADGYQTIRYGGAMRINYFAIDHKYRGKEIESSVRWSDYMLHDCLMRAREIRKEHVGLMFVVLSASNEGKHLYLRHGFSEMEADMTFHYSEDEKSNLGTAMYIPLDEE